MRSFFPVLTASLFLATAAVAQESSDEMTSETAVESTDESVAETLVNAEPAPAAKPALKPKPKPKVVEVRKPVAAAAKEKPKTETTGATALAPITKPDTDYVMMRVGSQDVAASEVRHMWEGLFPAGSAPDFTSLKPDMRDKVLRGVMTERLLLAEALKQGVDKSDVVQRELEDIKRKLIVKNFLEAKTADIDEKALRSEYESQVAAMKDIKEVRARHILVASEKEAVDVKKQLETSKSFDELARSFSKDPGSAKQGGDLGYFTKDKMVKEFADAAFDLKKGEISAPVKTSFGWHVIKLEDSRPVTVPTFIEAKDALKSKLQEKKLADYLRTVIKQTDVKLFDTKGKELPFSKDISEKSKNSDG